MKLIYRTLLLNKVCVQGSGVAAVVLLAKLINTVCSVLLFIKDVNYAEGPSPARGKAIIFCIVAIIKKE